MRWHVVALVALTILSGCAGAFDQEPTPTVTPVDVPPVDAQSPRYPAGLDERGLSSASALGDSHVRAVDGRSYVWEVRRCRAYVRNGSVEERDCGADVITYVDESTYRWNHTDGPDDGDSAQFERASSEDTYANGTVIFRRIRAPGRRWYEAERADGEGREFSFSAKRILQLYLAVNESTVRRVERDGETVYRVAGTGHRAPRYGRATDYRVVAFVDPSGLVVELRSTYARTYGNATVRTTVRSTYRDVGEAAVDPPPWIEAARENVSLGA